MSAAPVQHARRRGSAQPPAIITQHHNSPNPDSECELCLSCPVLGCLLVALHDGIDQIQWQQREQLEIAMNVLVVGLEQYESGMVMYMSYLHKVLIEGVRRCMIPCQPHRIASALACTHHRRYTHHPSPITHHPHIHHSREQHNAFKPTRQWTIHKVENHHHTAIQSQTELLAGGSGDERKCDAKRLLTQAPPDQLAS